MNELKNRFFVDIFFSHSNHMRPSLACQLCWTYSCKIKIGCLPYFSLGLFSGCEIKCVNRAISHYQNQCWLSFMMPYGTTRPQWVNEYYLEDFKQDCATSVANLLESLQSCTQLVVIHQYVWNVCIDGLMQERRNSIANALELRLSCTNPLLCRFTLYMLNFSEETNVFTFYAIPPHWHAIDSWNPSSYKTRTCLFYIVNT